MTTTPVTSPSAEDELCSRLLGLCRRAISANTGRSPARRSGASGATNPEARKREEGDEEDDEEDEEEEAVFSIVMNLLEDARVSVRPLPGRDHDHGAGGEGGGGERGGGGGEEVAESELGCLFACLLRTAAVRLRARHAAHTPHNKNKKGETANDGQGDVGDGSTAHVSVTRRLAAMTATLSLALLSRRSGEDTAGARSKRGRGGESGGQSRESLDGFCCDLDARVATTTAVMSRNGAASSSDDEDDDDDDDDDDDGNKGNGAAFDDDERFGVGSGAEKASMDRRQRVRRRRSTAVAVAGISRSSMAAAQEVCWDVLEASPADGALNFNAL